MALNPLFSPNGFSVGNLFNPTNVVLANGDITAGNAVSANFFLGNGSLLTGILTGNTTVSNTAPVSAQQGDVWIQANTGTQFIYFTSSGNSQWAEMEAALSISGGTSYGNSQVSAYLDGSVGNIIPAANITYSLGNSTRQWANLWVSGNTIYIGGISVGVANGLLTVGGNSVVTEGTSLSGNIETTGNIRAGNITINTGGNIFLPGNLVAGYRDIPQVTWTGTPTISYSDAGKHYYTAAGGVTLNIPTNSSVPLPIGAAISVINQSASNCTIARGSTTLYLAGNATSADRTLSHYGFASLVKVDTDTWFISGSNVI